MNSSYQAYKKDTAILLQWLSDTAEKCGFASQIQTREEPPKPSQRLKGKDRKKAKDAAAKKDSQHDDQPKEAASSREKRKVSIKEFLSQAKAITSSRNPLVPVPDRIIKAGLRAISARRKCATWFRSHFAHSGPSNEEHWFFIELLEDIMTILSANYDLPTPSKPTKTQETGSNTAPPTTATSPGKSKKTLENLFGILDLEEPAATSENERDAQPKEQSPSDARSSQIAKVTIDFEVEDEKEFAGENALFAAFCLYQDLHHLRQYVNTIWSAYVSNDMDLATASVITNTAFDLARRAEEDFKSVFPVVKSVDEMRQLVLDVLSSWAYKALDQGMIEVSADGPLLNDEETIEVSTDDLFLDEEDGNIYFKDRSSTSSIARGNVIQKPTQDGTEDLETVLRSANFLAEWMFMGPYQVLLSFREVLVPGQVPVIKRGYFGDYDPLADRSTMSTEEKKQEDRIILMEILPEFCFLTKVHGHTLVQDEWTRGLKEFVSTKEIPIWLTFSSQVFLDIHHLMRGTVSRALHEVQGLGMRAKETLVEYQAFVKKCKDVPSWAKLNAGSISYFEKLIDAFVLKDALISQKKKHKNWSETSSPIDNYYLLNRHPLLCGIFSFQIIMGLHHIGVGLAGGWGTMFIAHFYNAMKQQKEFPIKAWTDMDLMLAFNTEEHVFLGEAPKTMEDCFKKFCLMMGISAASFSNRRRAKTALASQRGPRGLKDMSPIIKLFRGPYLESSSLDYTTRNIEELLNSQGEGNQTKTSKKIRRLDRSSRLSPLDFLQTLRHALNREMPSLLFDYVQLHMHSQTLLNDLKHRLHNEFRTLIGDEYNETESDLPFLCVYVVQIAANVTLRSSVTRAQWAKGRTTVIKEASEALDDLVQNVGGKVGARSMVWLMDETRSKPTEAGALYLEEYGSILTGQVEKDANE